jgi:hypothetical protein
MIAALLIAINLYCLPTGERHACISDVIKKCESPIANQTTCVTTYMEQAK